MICKYQFFTSFCNEVTCRYAGFCLRSNLSCALYHVNSWFLKNFVTLSHLPSSVSPPLFPDLFFSSVVPFLLADCPYFTDMPVFIKTFSSPHFPPPLRFLAPLTAMKFSSLTVSSVHSSQFSNPTITLNSLLHALHLSRSIVSVLSWVQPCIQLLSSIWHGWPFLPSGNFFFSPSAIQRKC